MSKQPRNRSALPAGAFSPSLSDRLTDRVAKAARALDSERGLHEGADTARHRACLRAVFRELQAAHRQYRARTGLASSPALRRAAHAFKRTPSLASLAAVAAHLDEMKLLNW